MNLRLELKKKLFSEDELSRQLGISQASLKDSILENSKLNSNLSDLSLDNENIKRENADLKSEILQTQKCLNETDTELSEYKSQHVTLVEVRNSLRSQVSDLTTKLEDASSSAVKYEKELDENKIENSRLTKIIKEKEAQIKEYTQKLLADQIQIDDLHVRLKVGLLTADRIRQAEAKQRETAEKLVRSEERLCLVQQDYYQANKFHSKSEVEAKKSKSKLQNQVESACSQLDNLQAENTANIALFEKLREKLVLSKEISFLVDPGCPEGREDIVETICSLLHDLESQSFVLTLQNKRLLEESETAIESNEKLWSDVEQLMEEVLRLKSTKEAPLFTNVAAECLDEYIKASYADDSPLNHSKPGYHPDIEAYRRLINELQQSAEINSQGIASPTPAYPDTTDTHNLNSIPPNLANRQMSNITNNLSVNRDDRSLRQTSTGHQIIQDKSQKQKRSLNQKCIRQRIAAMANELENLKVVYFDLENYCLMKNKMQDKL